MQIKKRFQQLFNDPPKKTIWLIGKKILPWFFRESFDELRQFPRFTTTKTLLEGKDFFVADAPSFFSAYREIFTGRIYQFRTKNPRPRIIDAGANIGLGTIFFKKLYPNADIICFEPDPRVCDILRRNLHSFGFNDVTVFQKALSDHEGALPFFSQGADGGRLIEANDANDTIHVPTIRLRDFLTKQIDFLKIDIEGAETDVITDCADLLCNVQNLFVEYHSRTDDNQQLHTLLSHLHDAGFRYYIHTGGVRSPQPFDEKKIYDGMDMQLNIFACRF